MVGIAPSTRAHDGEQAHGAIDNATHQAATTVKQRWLGGPSLQYYNRPGIVDWLRETMFTLYIALNIPI